MFWKSFARLSKRVPATLGESEAKARRKESKTASMVEVPVEPLELEARDPVVSCEVSDSLIPFAS